MNANEQLINKFYTAFQQKDWKTMQACYHPEIEFNDAVFKNLKGKKAGAMWHMLLAGAKDLALTFDGISADENNGKAHWVATYTFSQTGKKVVNDIHAAFEFKDGLIIKHTDSFDFKNWSKQAFGFVGSLLGGTTFFNNFLSAKVSKTLQTFMKKAKYE